MGRIRNRRLENVAEEFEFECEHGCGEKALLGPLINHEKKCEKRPHQCLHSDCKFKGHVGDFVQHYISSHEAHDCREYQNQGVVELPFLLSGKWSQMLSWPISLLEFNGTLVTLNVRFSGRVLQVCLALAHECSPTLELWGSLILAKHGREFKYVGPVNRAADEMFGSWECLTVNKNMAKFMSKYITGEGEEFTIVTQLAASDICTVKPSLPGSSSSSAPVEDELQKGSSVVLHSLQMAKFNGFEGKVLGRDKETNRYTVHLESGETIKVQTKNLKIVK